jgi:hypothetical protein
MQKIFRYVWRHKLVQCADRHHEARVQATSSTALSHVTVIKQILTASAHVVSVLFVLFPPILHSNHDLKATIHT